MASRPADRLYATMVVRSRATNQLQCAAQRNLPGKFLDAYPRSTQSQPAFSGHRSDSKPAALFLRRPAGARFDLRRSAGPGKLSRFAGHTYQAVLLWLLTVDRLHV